VIPALVIVVRRLLLTVGRVRRHRELMAVMVVAEETLLERRRLRLLRLRAGRACRLVARNRVGGGGQGTRNRRGAG
jgi:hypothetical protein